MSDFIYAGRVRLVVGCLAAPGIALQVGSYIWQAKVALEKLGSWRIAQDVGAVALVYVVLGYVVVSMFPRRSRRTGVRRTSSPVR